MKVQDIIKLEQPPPKVLQLLDEQVEGFDAVKWRDQATGKSTLHLAIETGRLKLVKLLLERGCDVNATDLQGCTPLCSACKIGRLDMVKVMVGHGVDVHKATYTLAIDVADGVKTSSMPVHGMIALACALLYRHLEIVAYLVKQGVRLNSTALAIAIKADVAKVKLVLGLETEGSFDSEFYRATIMTAVKHGHGQVLGILLKARRHLVPKLLQDELVNIAVVNDRLSIVRLLYESGWRLPDAFCGRTLAYMAKSIDMLEYLLFTLGCDACGIITGEGSFWSTVVHGNCEHGTLEHVSLLKWAGADINARDCYGLTPMAYALHGVSLYPQLVCRYLEHCGIVKKQVCLTAHQRAILRKSREHVLEYATKRYNRPQLTKEQQEQEFHRVVCGVKRRVRARVKARCRRSQDFYPLLWAVHSEPGPLVTQSAVDSSIDRFYSQRDALAQGVDDSMASSLSSVATRDSVVAADGGVYARASIKSWIEECLREDGVIVSPTTGQVMSSTVLMPAWTAVA